MQEKLFQGQNPMQKNKLQEINPLSLAFLGDGIHTMYVRNHICRDFSYSHTKQHFESAKFCKATTQSRVLDSLMPMLSDEEKAIVKRARNVKSTHVAKNSNLEEYKKATSLEALIGYLFLMGDSSRLDMVLSESIKGENVNDN